jgi:hypothetical protein
MCLLLYMCPHAGFGTLHTIYRRLYTCPNTTICVLILYICVLMQALALCILYIDDYMCVLILLCVLIVLLYASSYHYVCPHTTTICVLELLLYVC